MATLFPLALPDKLTDITVELIRAHEAFYNNHAIIEDDLRFSNLVETTSLEILKLNPQIPESKIIIDEQIYVPIELQRQVATLRTITNDQFVVINSPTSIKLPLLWLNNLPQDAAIIPIIQTNYTDRHISSTHFYKTLFELLPKLKRYLPILPIIAEEEPYIRTLSNLLAILKLPFNADIFTEHFDPAFPNNNNKKVYTELKTWLSNLQPHRKILTN